MGVPCFLSHEVSMHNDFLFVLALSWGCDFEPHTSVWYKLVLLWFTGVSSFSHSSRQEASFLEAFSGCWWSLLGCFMNGTTAHLGFSSLPHPLTPTEWIHALACRCYPQTFISLLNLRPLWPHLANTPCSHFLSWVLLCFWHLGVFPFTSSSAICKTVFGEILSSTFWQNCGGRFFCI